MKHVDSIAFHRHLKSSRDTGALGSSWSPPKADAAGATESSFIPHHRPAKTFPTLPSHTLVGSVSVQSELENISSQEGTLCNMRANRHNTNGF